MRATAILAAVVSLSTSGAGRQRVVAVSDGDTWKVRTRAGIETIRAIGLDCPEVHHPRQPVGRCGPEAEAYARLLLTGEDVEVERHGRDRYGRTLAYVWLRNLGTELRTHELANRQLIEAGLCRAYRKYPHRMMAEFIAAEGRARARGLYLWGEGCASPTQ